MKLILINQSADAVSSTTLHGVTIPAQFNSESERSALLDTLFDLDLTKPQVTEVRNAIKAVKVAVATDTANGVERKYVESWQDLYGSFDMNTGRSEGGTKDLLKDWNKAGSYDCGDADFQISTGTIKKLVYECKDTDSTIFNSFMKRSMNNIKSDVVSFRKNDGTANTMVNGDRCTLEEANEALAMLMEAQDVAIREIKAFYQKLADANLQPVTLENVRARLAAKKQPQTESAETKAEEKVTADKPTETAAPEKVAA